MKCVQSVFSDIVWSTYKSTKMYFSINKCSKYCVKKGLFSLYILSIYKISVGLSKYRQ